MRVLPVFVVSPRTWHVLRVYETRPGTLRTMALCRVLKETCWSLRNRVLSAVIKHKHQLHRENLYPETLPRTQENNHLFRILFLAERVNPEKPFLGCMTD